MSLGRRRYQSQPRRCRPGQQLFEHSMCMSAQVAGEVHVTERDRHHVETLRPRGSSVAVCGTSRPEPTSREPAEACAWPGEQRTDSGG
jgi:hypothetical protein